MERGKILKLSDLKDMHDSISLEYTGILYAGRVDREKAIHELARNNPQEFFYAIGVNDNAESFKDVSPGSLDFPMRFFNKLKGE
nr:MAG TPA: uracil phosphoribosyltransferase [Caudoviricetes sp.]